MVSERRFSGEGAELIHLELCGSGAALQPQELRSCHLKWGSTDYLKGGLEEMLAQCQARSGPSEMVATSFNMKIILSDKQNVCVPQCPGNLPTARPPSCDCQAAQSVLPGGQDKGEASLWGGGLHALTWLCLGDGFFSLALGPSPLLFSPAS